MKKFFFITLTITVLLVVLGYQYFTREQAIEVTAKSVERGLVESTVSNTRAGTVKARNRADLTPPIGGQIATLNVRKADHVKAGQILLTLWNKDLEAEKRLAESEVVAAKATQRERCLLADLAERQARRQKDLMKTRSTSASNYDEAISAARAQRAACVAAQARLSVSQARVEAAKATLERTVLTAPFDGIVAEVNGEIGEYLTPSPPGIATLPAIDLINMDSLYVAAPIDEIDAAQIRTGMAVRISLDAFPKQFFPGRVHSISPYVLEVAKQARTVEIEADFAEGQAPANLLAGYSADVEIIIAAQSETVRIPSEALMVDNSVYLFDENSSRVQKIQVQPGLSNWKYTQILEGLSPGQKVITSIDRKGLKNGALVMLAPAEDAGS
nr:efflux RND transporter periplasmic adaptor subunit [uncultured Desulfobulbus sp.]